MLLTRRRFRPRPNPAGDTRVPLGRLRDWLNAACDSPDLDPAEAVALLRRTADEVEREMGERAAEDRLVFIAPIEA